MRTTAAGAAAVLALIVGYAASAKLSSEADRAASLLVVEVVTQVQGPAAEDIEHAITVPIEMAMAGIPRVTAIHTISAPGLSDVRVSFGDGFTRDEAERSVMSRLSQLSSLPGGGSPQISSQSPVGEMYRYRIVGPSDYSLTDFRTVQNWVLQRRFQAVPGVVDVSGWVGGARAYEITVDLDKLAGSGATLPQVIEAINKGNPNLGGQTVNIGPQSAVVRGVEPIRPLDDLRNTVLIARNGAPVHVKDVATVATGHESRLRDGNDMVQGIVLTRGDQEGASTIRRIETELDQINSSDVLPPGMRLVRVDDRQG
jgi:cobalt-zinc-cadmium resistance protein CzcA